MKRVLFLTCVSVALLSLALFNPKTQIFRAQASPEPAAEQVAAVPLYWYFNKFNEFHFFTASLAEGTAFAKTQQAAGWKYMGTIGWVFPQQVPGSVPLYRLVKEEDEPKGVNHFMTVDKAEADHAANNLGWHFEGIMCYVSPKQVAGTVHLYRLYRPLQDLSGQGSGLIKYTTKIGDTHYYTVSEEDMNEYVNVGYTLVRTEAFIWSKATTISLGGASGNSVIKPPQPPPPASAKDQLFSLGCTQDGTKQIKCPSVQGWELCNFYKKKGDINVTYCSTSADQFAFANLEHDLSARGCTRFLGRAGQYLCQTLNGAQACQGYLKKGDGLVTKCISVKQAQMAKDLSAHGCKSFLGRDDDYYCSSADGLKLCNNYHLDGQVKTCRQQQ
jgi:hypothetical protein